MITSTSAVLPSYKNRRNDLDSIWFQNQRQQKDICGQLEWMLHTAKEITFTYSHAKKMNWSPWTWPPCHRTSALMVSLLPAFHSFARIWISLSRPFMKIVISSIWLYDLTVASIIWSPTLLGHLKPMGLVLHVQITCAAPYRFKREFKQWANIFSGMSCEWG